MAIYNESIVIQRKEEITGVYKVILGKMLDDHIPAGFDTYAGLLEATIPFMPDDERLIYSQGLSLGTEQIDLLRQSKLMGGPNDSLSFKLAQGKKGIEYWLIDSQPFE
jgi:hypothetical protein